MVHFAGWLRNCADNMCRVEGKDKKCEKESMETGGKTKPASVASSRSPVKRWMVHATTSLLLWTCVVQFTTLGETWGPRVLKGWPACHYQRSSVSLKGENVPSAPAARILPPKSESSFVFLWMVPLKIRDVIATISLRYNKCYTANEFLRTASFFILLYFLISDFTFSSEFSFHGICRIQFDIVPGF